MALDFLDGVTGGIGGMGGFVSAAIYILAGTLVLVMCGGIIWYIIKRKKGYNILVEFKIPRSDGKFLTAEWGKGFYDLKRGVVYVKRNKQKPVPIEPFEVSKYLQGTSNILTVVQIAPDYYLPVLPESFLEMEDDKTNEKATLIKFASDFTKSKSWKNSFERETKQAYTIMNLLRDYAPMIGIGIILFMNFAGFAILYSKVT